MPSPSNTSKDEKQCLPIFPLPLVLFPGMRLPLHIFEPRYQTMLHHIMADKQQFGVTLYLQTTQKNVAITTAIGTLAKVTRVNEHDGGWMDIMTQGLQRFKLLEVDNETQPYLQGIIEPYADRLEAPIDPLFFKNLKEKYQTMARLSHQLLNRNASAHLPETINPEELSYRIGEHLNQNITVQQGFLELQSTLKRLQREEEFMDPIISRLVAMTQINAAFSDDNGPLTDSE